MEGPASHSSTCILAGKIAFASMPTHGDDAGGRGRMECLLTQGAWIIMLTAPREMPPPALAHLWCAGPDEDRSDWFYLPAGTCPQVRV